MPEWRKPLRNLSVPRRAIGLRPIHRVKGSRLINTGKLLLILARRNNQTANTKARLRRLALVFLRFGLNEFIAPPIFFPPVPLRVVTIEGLDWTTCRNLYRFEKEHLRLFYDLLRNLGMPANFGRFNSEWCFLLLLKWLATGESYTLLAMNTFGVEATQISRALYQIIEWVHDNVARQKMHSNIAAFVPRFPMYAQKIRAKVLMNARSTNIAAQQDDQAPEWKRTVLNNLPNPYRVIGFLDGTQQWIAVPGAGPIGGGPNAPRREDAWEIQRAFFSRKAHAHTALKYITCVAPDGITMYCSEPYSGRNHDVNVLDRIGLNLQMVDAQPNIAMGHRKILYGDLAFGEEECIRRAHPPPQTNAQLLENSSLNACRTSVEHEYGQVLNLFKGLRCWWTHHAGSRVTRVQFVVTTFIYNCYVCCYNNQLSTYYDCQAPSLADYLRPPHPPAPNP